MYIWCNPSETAGQAPEFFVREITYWRSLTFCGDVKSKLNVAQITYFCRNTSVDGTEREAILRWPILIFKYWILKKFLSILAQIYYGHCSYLSKGAGPPIAAFEKWVTEWRWFLSSRLTIASFAIIKQLSSLALILLLPSCHEIVSRSMGVGSSWGISELRPCQMMSQRFLFHIPCTLFPVRREMQDDNWNIWHSSLDVSANRSPEHALL
jgi:hypothetical protein